MFTRKSLYGVEETAGRNRKVKGDSGENHAGRNEEYATANWRKGDPYYKLAKNWAELCSSI